MLLCCYSYRSLSQASTDDYNNLDSNAVLLMKRMIRDALPNPDTANLREIMGAIARFEVCLEQSTSEPYLMLFSYVDRNTAKEFRKSG